MSVKDIGQSLGAFVERQLGCGASFIEEIDVATGDAGQPSQSVSVFEVHHPNAKHAYAWMLLDTSSNDLRFFAVLGVEPVSSAADALQAAKRHRCELE